MLMTASQAESFRAINAGYNGVFKPGQLTVGLVVPIEHYPHGPVPTLAAHIERVQLAEQLDFAAVWLRDVPFNVPSFGDAGHVFDPFVYLGALATATSSIALGVASIVLPLRHPAHVAKAAASADQLSEGRLILGIASGDRPEEFPALAAPFEDRGALFRESYAYIREMGDTGPLLSNDFGTVSGGIDMLPKATGSHLPLLVTGSSQQSPDWIAANADGWMTYPRAVEQQASLIDDYRARIEQAGQPDKPVMEPLYIDLAAEPDAPARPIHLGYRLGVNTLRNYLESRQAIGVNHVALNLRFNGANIEETLAQLAETILPTFSAR
ncbi:MAG: LLM class oxidoreductase [Pseudomonadota bacterium]